MSWILLYFIFPSWIHLHSKVHSWGVLQSSNPAARLISVLGLSVYFLIGAVVTSHYFDALSVQKPIFIKINNVINLVKDHVWLTLACVLAVILHIPSFSLVQATYLNQGLWMYEFSDRLWHAVIDVPIQYAFWVVLIFSLLILTQKKISHYASHNLSTGLSGHMYWGSFALLFLIFSGLFCIYSYFFPYLTSGDALQLLRYPPVSHFLYLLTYYAFGVTHEGPRIVQLTFNIAGAVYLYRTILLFRDRKTALLGLAIFLFSPAVFYYASMSALTSGKLFFIIAISYYFLSYIKTGEKRDLILTAFFSGTGYLYKQDVLIIFVTCVTYFTLMVIKRRDWNSLGDLRILLLSLIPILPWHLVMGTSSVYYEIVLSKLMSVNRMTAYAVILQSQLSTVFFIAVLKSVIFVFFAKKDDMSLFFGLAFVAYYLFYTLGETIALHRYAMSLYPAIAVLLAQFLYSISARVRWKHTFILIFLFVGVYMIVLSIMPRSISDITTFRYKDIETQYYPMDKAADWIRGRAGKDERIVTLFLSFNFFAEKLYEDNDEINPDRFITYRFMREKGFRSPFDVLKKFCKENNIAYVMLKYSPNNDWSAFDSQIGDQMEYLKNKMDSEFLKASQFNIEDNYIIIYKVII